MTRAMSGNAAQLYKEDFLRWTEQQSRALREAAKIGTNLPLDWENLAEEIDDLGRSVRHELRSRISTIIEHLLKLEHFPATDPRRGSIETVTRERSQIEPLLDESPSLRREVAGMMRQVSPGVARLTTRVLRLHGENVGNLSPPGYTEDQVLGGWFPGDIPLPASEEREGSA